MMKSTIESCLKKFRGNLFIAFILATGFLVTGILTFVLQAVVYVTVRPWSLGMYRKMSWYFSAGMYWHQLMLVHWWSNTEIKIQVDPNDLKNHLGKEHSILLMNHKYEIDILIITALCNYFGMEGNLRGFAKKSLQYLPIFGWLWKLQEHIFLERNFEKDQKILEESICSLLGNGEDPVTLVLFPEGTRFTEDKHRISMEVARGKGLKELKHHLLPRTRGFETCVKSLKSGKFEGSLPVAIYDGLVVMEGGKGDEGGNFSFGDLTKGRGPKVKIILKRYCLEDVPVEGAGKWLHERYQEKDKMMNGFLEGNGGEGWREGKFLCLRKPGSVLALIGIWDGVVFYYLFRGLLGILMSGGIWVWGGVVLGVVGGTKAFKMIGDITKIDKGSEYGQDKRT